MLIKYWGKRKKSHLFLDTQNSCLTCLFVSLQSNEYLNKVEMVEKLGQMWKLQMAKNSSQVCMLTSEHHDCTSPIIVKWMWVWPFHFLWPMDISKQHKQRLAHWGLPFLLYRILQQPSCVWAQANLLHERNVIITPAGTAPTTRHTSKIS